MANDDKLWTQQNIQAIAKSAAREVMQSQGGLALPCQVIAINPNNPATGQPNLYIEPDEGEFLLPAVTIQLVEEGASTYSPGDRNVHKRGYWSQLQLVIKVYG